VCIEVEVVADGAPTSMEMGHVRITGSASDR
jgi:hypothetical protein